MDRFRVKTLNKISPIVNKYLTEDKFIVGDEEENEQGILVRSANCHQMELNDDLLAIVRAGAGVNNIPIEKCSQKGIAVFNTPGANANAVKELVLGSMLMATRNMYEGIAWTKTLVGKGEDIPALVEDGKKAFVGPEILGKTLGVIGLGAIGVLVSNAAEALGMTVMGYDPFISVESAWELDSSVHRSSDLHEMLKQCDFVTIHIPYMKETANFIDAKELDCMKENAVLLNFSRGEIVNEKSLIEALNAGKLKKYVTDFPTEGLLAADKVITVPHLGASTPESEENCAKMAAKQLRDYLMFGTLKNSVNLPHCVLPYKGNFRIMAIHLNVKNMVGQMTTLLAKNNANIADMINKSKGEYAVTVIDLDERVDDAVIDEMRNIDNIIKIRVIG